MPTFQYTAKDLKGGTSKGNLEAPTLAAFYEQLEKQDLLCLSYRQITEKAIAMGRYKLKSKDLIVFCRKISTMLGAGMTITSCLDIMCSTAEKPQLKKIYLELYENVKGGKPLSAAMQEQGNAFPPLLIHMLESGEESGNIDLITSKLSSYYEKQGKIASKIKTATTYPKLLAVVALAVVIILFTFVLPQIFVVFQEQDLPKITVFMMGISHFLTNYWYICIGILIAIYLLAKLVLRSTHLRLLKDKLSITLPIIGLLVKKIYSARFASTLAILYSSGLSLLSSLKLSVNVISNTHIQKTLDQVMENVSIGQALSSAIEEADVFDKLLASMIKIGEESGSLDSILASISEYYEEETTTATETLLAILEPALLVVMAIIIGFILISVLLPIFNSYGQIG